MKPMTSQSAAPGGAQTESAYVSSLKENGYLILDHLLSSGEVRSIADELNPHFDATPRCEGDFYGWRTTRMGSVLTKAPSTQALVLHPVIRSIVEPILGPHCDYVQLNLVQAVRVHAGERRQAPHRDEEMWPAQKYGTPWLINVMWAIDDFTAPNGATRLWPGTHKETLDRFVDESASVPAEMPSGSACLFMGSLTHAAGANQTLGDRTGIIVSYCLGWLKTYENQFLTYPPDVARSFSPDLQQLIGYRIHRPNLGGWNGQDPGILLKGPTGPVPHADALPDAIQAELAAYYEAA